MSELMEVCVMCKTAVAAKEGKNWEGGDWGGVCKFCGAPTITCEPEDIDAAYEAGQRR